MFTLKKILLILLLGMVLFLPACSPAGPSVPSLKGTKWRVVEIGGQAVPEALGVTVEFGSGGQLGGKAPCNHYFADYTQHGSRLSFGTAGATLMACADNDIMALEQAFLQDLALVSRFQADAGRLLLQDESGKTLITLGQ
jgi:heat shock protein HslJ